MAKSRKTKSHFHFKQFSIADDRCSMKVGTDAVLLGAWSDVTNTKYILDIGSGSGVIALMLAQRSDKSAHIDAVEISSSDADQSKENVLQSPWSSRVSIHNVSIQEFKCAHRYDLIVSNPPYFADSLKSPDEGRTTARHTETLNHQSLIEAVLRSINSEGKFCLILPATEAEAFVALTNRHGLYCRRRTIFRSREHKPVERVLMEFQVLDGMCVEETLMLYRIGDAWTPEYQVLTSPFYLKQK